MRRVRFFIDLGLGRTNAEHFDFPDEVTNDKIDDEFVKWKEEFNQGWEELHEVPSIYKQEVNNDPGTDSILLQSDSTEQSLPLEQQSEMCSALDPVHEVPRKPEA